MWKPKAEQPVSNHALRKTPFVVRRVGSRRLNNPSRTTPLRKNTVRGEEGCGSRRLNNPSPNHTPFETPGSACGLDPTPQGERDLLRVAPAPSPPRPVPRRGATPPSPSARIAGSGRRCRPRGTPWRGRRRIRTPVRTPATRCRACSHSCSRSWRPCRPCAAAATAASDGSNHGSTTSRQCMKSLSR